MTQDELGKMLDAATLASQQKSLEFLFDYTKFHIGLYLTLTASYIAVASIKVNEKFVFRTNPQMVWMAVICFMLAGLAGGVIASSITQTDARSSVEFLTRKIGPWEVTWFQMKGLTWTWIEHTSFWIGLILAFLSTRRVHSSVRKTRQ